MNAEEIRKMHVDDNASDFWLREIAAQLADLNQHLVDMSEGEGGYLSVRAHPTT